VRCIIHFLLLVLFFPLLILQELLVKPYLYQSEVLHLLLRSQLITRFRPLNGLSARKACTDVALARKYHRHRCRSCSRMLLKNNSQFVIDLPDFQLQLLSC
jgi:hypothetical protein